MTRERLGGLDALRGIAALCVVGYHIVPSETLNAYLAVDFFFMLSGYVMARSWENRLSTAGPASVLPFVKARAMRLWPLIALGTLIGAVMHLGSEPRLGMVLVAGLLMVPLDDPRGPYPLNIPSWSIVYELVANALHALVLARLGNRMLALLIVVLVALLAWTVHPHKLAIDATPANRVIVAVRALVPYAIGILLYRRWRDMPPVAPPAWLTWLLLPGWFALGWAWLGRGFVQDIGFVLLVCPVLIAGGLRHARDAGWAVALGALSFPLYAIHDPIVRALRDAGEPLAVQFALPVLVATLLTWGLARWRRSGREGGRFALLRDWRKRLHPRRA